MCFLRVISDCVGLCCRYNIIAEIMQATTIQNLKRAKGQDTGVWGGGLCWGPLVSVEGSLISVG